MRRQCARLLWSERTGEVRVRHALKLNTRAIQRHHSGVFQRYDCIEFGGESSWPSSFGKHAVGVSLHHLMAYVSLHPSSMLYVLFNPLRVGPRGTMRLHLVIAILASHVLVRQHLIELECLEFHAALVASYEPQARPLLCSAVGTRGRTARRRSTAAESREYRYSSRVSNSFRLGGSPGVGGGGSSSPLGSGTTSPPRDSELDSPLQND